MCTNPDLINEAKQEAQKLFEYFADQIEDASLKYGLSFSKLGTYPDIDSIESNRDMIVMLAYIDAADSDYTAQVPKNINSLIITDGIYEKSIKPVKLHAECVLGQESKNKSYIDKCINKYCKDIREKIDLADDAISNADNMREIRYDVIDLLSNICIDNDCELEYKEYYWENNSNATGIPMYEVSTLQASISYGSEKSLFSVDLSDIDIKKLNKNTKARIRRLKKKAENPSSFEEQL